MRRTWWRRWGTIFGIAVAVAAGVPAFAPRSGAEAQESASMRIAHLEISPPISSEGCPVSMRFELEDPGGEARRAVVHWDFVRRGRRNEGQRAMDLPVAGDQTTRSVVLELRPRPYGHYLYQVYVESPAGRQSNLLTAALDVKTRPFFASCS